MCDHTEFEFVLDTLGYIRPVKLSMHQLPQTAVELPCTTDYTSSRVQHSLQLVGDDLWSPSEDNVTVVDAGRHACTSVVADSEVSERRMRRSRRILTGHSQLNRHLSVMGIISDPTCNYCEEGLETAARFLCECSHFVKEIWGKSYLHPSEADSVQNLVRFILKSHRFS